MKLHCDLCETQMGIKKVWIDPETHECLNGLSWWWIVKRYIKYYIKVLTCTNK
jgi:hypothetical protein